ncbi:MAG: valine--tRNA ligase [Planctomycetota bacterium]|nr:valine--tRNA ligase [Planctomycetota bacterium]
MTTSNTANGEMETRYDPAQVESEIRSLWEEGKASVAGQRPDAEPFTMMMPPPNVTGVLHMGHALNGTLQDIVARHRRLSGHDVLWVPGTDHAGIATQAVVEKKLYAETGQTREDVGREAFLEKVWSWKEEHGNTILEQFKRLGSSCDWTRTHFTLDPGFSQAVRVAFVRLWEQGLVYRGARLVNWDCVLQTAISDDEIEHQQVKGHLWHMRYPVKGEEGRTITVATTRPETMLGDSGVAVHPDDARYKDLQGKTLLLPLIDREIPVVADDTVDPEFGSGAVKITPGHDPNDYDRGIRFDLPLHSILERDGTLSESAGDYAGMTREKAREQVLADLEKLGLLEKVEDHEHAVPLSDRSKSPVEPLVSEQWFVKMEPLADPAIRAVKTGALRFQPARWSKVYLEWLENVRDWCISRQLWWGHRIPVWYDEDGEPTASVEDLELGSPHPVTGKPIVRQDEDVLDTWASSWLWPIATLGWPEKTDSLQRYYPTQFLSTGSEIIYLWVARMVMSGYAFMDDLAEDERCPFETCYIHATVLDEKGRRMSKSLGNGIDPIDMIDQYGADGIRFALVMLTKEGQDTRLSPEKFEMGRNFVNKIWNASRFVLGRAGRLPSLNPDQAVALEDRWILSRLAATTAEVTSDLEGYRFNEAGQRLYRFVWNDVCDWYVEAVKPRLDGDSPDPVAAAILGRVLTDMLTLLHPFIPFATEAIWQRLRTSTEVELDELLMLSPWPEGKDLTQDETVEMSVGAAQTVVSSLRKLRQQNNVGDRKPVRVTVAVGREATLVSLQQAEELLCRLGDVESLDMGVDPHRPEGVAADVTDGMEILLDLEGLVDRVAQKEDLTRNLGKIAAALHVVEGKLSDENFVAKAPAEVVDRERSRKNDLDEEKARIEQLLSALSDSGSSD